MLFRIVIFVSIVLIFDIYAYQAIRTLTEDLSVIPRRVIKIGYWVINVSLYILGFLTMAGFFAHSSKGFLVFLSGVFFAFFAAKMLMMIPMLMEDIYRIINRIYTFFVPEVDGPEEGAKLIGRKKFISQISAGIGGLTVAGMSYGIIKGAHDYKIHREKIPLANLPSSFKGLKIGHLSDIHSGSFWDKEAVKRGVEKLMKEQPDIIFFTGDLVNSLADEMTDDYIQLFSQLKAPMGVYSILGNHDYGDYHQWPDRKEFGQGNNSQSNKSHMTPMQLANLEKLHGIHKQMGWDLLLNEHRILEKDGDKIALIGIENFGARGNFARYGRLHEAYAGTEQYPVKILLSHDPSHWDYEVREYHPERKTNRKIYGDIDLTLSGHTHGAQFGLESMGIKWSPIKYVYKQWAGLYQSGNQYIYVNRGFGYLGYPGRLGIRPEIGILTLV